MKSLHRNRSLKAVNGPRSSLLLLLRYKGQCLLSVRQVGRAFLIAVMILPAVVTAQDADTEADAALETMIVTATPLVDALASLPGSHSSINAETIERRLMRNIKDLIRYEPGIDVVNDPQRFGMSGFNIRGIGGNRVQMLVDGIRMPEAFSIGSFQSAGRNMVDIDALITVDIVRGANSAVNGSDGIAGTVSFVSKDPRDYLDIFGKDHYASLKLLYGSASDNLAETLTLAGALNQWESLVLFTHAAGGETDTMGSNDSLSAARTVANPQDSQTYNFLGKLLYQVNADNRVRLSAEALHNSLDTDVYHLYGLNYTGRNTLHFLTADTQSRWRMSLDQTLDHIGWRWLEHAQWRLYGQVSDTQQVVDERRRTPLKQNEQLMRVFDFSQAMVGGDVNGRVQFNYAPASHTLNYGAELLSTAIDAFRDGSLTNLDSGKVSHQITPDSFPLRDFPLTSTLRGGLFLQDEISLWNKRLTLIPALRLDYFSLTPENDALFAKDNPGTLPNELEFFEPSPKFGVLWKLDELISLHGQYAEGFRAPNFSEANLGFVNYTFGYTSIPNANLKPETSWGGELGLRAEGKVGFFDATVFQTHFQGFIQSAIACDPASDQSCNNGLLTYQTQNTLDEVQIQGFEFKSEWRLKHLHPTLQGLNVLASFAYTEGKNLGNGKPISSISPMNGVLGLRYDSPGSVWGTEALLTLVAPKTANKIDFEVAGDVFPVAGFATLDLNAFYHFGEHVTLTAGVFNLLDKKYIQWQDVRSRGSDPHAGLAGANDIRDRYTRPGRNMGLSLKVEF